LLRWMIIFAITSVFIDIYRNRKKLSRDAKAVLMRVLGTSCLWNRDFGGVISLGLLLPMMYLIFELLYPLIISFISLFSLSLSQFLKHKSLGILLLHLDLKVFNSLMLFFNSLLLAVNKKRAWVCDNSHTLSVWKSTSWLSSWHYTTD
jgi:predicted Co/Zn/Cd cation transporter (cation efflux family)